MSQVTTDPQFIEIWVRLRSPALIAKELGVSVRSVYDRRNTIAGKYGIELETVKHTNFVQPRPIPEYPGRIMLEIPDGVVVVFSDAHYWPDIESTAHKALVQFIPMLQPKAIVCNGDAFDGGAISRWPRIGWDSKPTVADELKVVTERLGEIEEVSKGCDRIWTLGNHDSRYETFLAARVPEFQGVKGFTLKEHFPNWKPAWTCWINPSSYTPTCITHRYKGGIHATHNNAVNSGLNYVTGHLHSLKVTPFTDLRDTRFGVDTGTLANPSGPQFIDYTEDSPKNQRSGFAVLTYNNGRLLWPELVHVLSEDLVEFRGKVYKV